MKINEIAINENLLTKGASFVGKALPKALPRIERLPGETMTDAIKRAKSELAGVKSADNLASPTSPGPAVWRRPGETGGGSSRPFSGSIDWPGRRPLPGPGVTVDQLRTPANGPAAMNIDSAKRAAQANAAKRAAAAKSAETPAPKPEMIAEPLPSWLFPKGAKGSKTPSGQQSSGGPAAAPGSGPAAAPGSGPAAAPGSGPAAAPGSGPAAAPGSGPAAAPGSGPAAAPGSGPGVHPAWFQPPPASGTTAPPPVININTGKESSWRPGWKTGLTAAAAGPWAYNNLSPKDFPKIPDSVADWPVNLFTAGYNNLLNNRGATDLKDLTGIKVEPTPTVVEPEEQPTQTQVDKAKADDTDNQKASKRVDDWNRDHPDDPIKESYTNELNRIVFLSRP